MALYFEELNITYLYNHLCSVVSGISAVLHKCTRVAVLGNGVVRDSPEVPCGSKVSWAKSPVGLFHCQWIYLCMNVLSPF